MRASVRAVKRKNKVYLLYDLEHSLHTSLAIAFVAYAFVTTSGSSERSERSERRSCEHSEQRLRGRARRAKAETGEHTEQRLRRRAQRVKAATESTASGGRTATKCLQAGQPIVQANQ